MENSLENLEVVKASQDDWDDILEILEETRLIIWFTGGETYHKFYIVRDQGTNQIICCFQIAQEGEVGILRSFAMRKNLQKKGIGRYIVNNEIPSIAKNLGIKRLYARGNDVGDFKTNGFWRKTIFKHVLRKDIKDKYFRDDIEGTIKKYSPEEFYRESGFLLILH